MTTPDTGSQHCYQTLKNTPGSRPKPLVSQIPPTPLYWNPGSTYVLGIVCNLLEFKELFKKKNNHLFFLKFDYRVYTYWFTKCGQPVLWEILHSWRVLELFWSKWLHYPFKCSTCTMRDNVECACVCHFAIL